MPPLRSRAAVRARREEIETRALEVVRRHLAEGHPYSEISFKAIADELGVPRTTLYMQFRDKTELLMRLSEVALAEVYDAAASWFVFDHRTGPEGAKEAGMETLATFREHRDVTLAVIEVTTYDPVLADHWYANVNDFATRAAQALQPLQEAGHIAPDVDLQTLAFTLVCMVERAAMIHIRHGDPADDEKVAAAVGRAVWLSIYGDAEPLGGSTGA